MRRRPPTFMPGHALVPARDDLARRPSPKREGVVAVPAGVELLPGAPGHPDVVDLDLGAGRGLGALPDLEVLGDQLGGRAPPRRGRTRAACRQACVRRTASRACRLRSPAMPPTPPAAPAAPTRSPLHGDERVDDWYWLRSDDRERPGGAGPPRGGERLRRRGPRPHRGLQDALFEEMKARIKETDLSVPFRKGGRWFYSRTEEGQQYPILCRTDVAAAGRPRRRGRRSPARRCCSTSTCSPATATTSPSAPTTSRPARTGSLYSTDHDGSEQYTTADPRPRAPAPTSPTPSRARPTARRGPATTPSSTSAPTTRCARSRCGGTPSGTDAADDVLVYEEPDERFFVSRRPEPHRGVGAHLRPAPR